MGATRKNPAARGGIKHVLIPEENRRDLDEVPDNIKQSLDIHPVQWVDEVIEVADRIVVMNSGMLAGEQLAGEIQRDALLHWTAQSTEELIGQE